MSYRRIIFYMLYRLFIKDVRFIRSYNIRYPGFQNHRWKLLNMAICYLNVDMLNSRTRDRGNEFLRSRMMSNSVRYIFIKKFSDTHTVNKV